MTVALRSTLACCLALAVLSSCSPGDQAAPKSFPPRPVDVAVDGVDPCTLLDAPQQATLQLRRSARTTTSVNGLPSAVCTWIRNDGDGYNIQTISVAAEIALAEPGAEPISVNGFGAARRPASNTSGDTRTCQITIDVAPDRSIRVQARAAPTPPQPSDTELCQRAAEAASMVMTTVVSSSG